MPKENYHLRGLVVADKHHMTGTFGLLNHRPAPDIAEQGGQAVLHPEILPPQFFPKLPEPSPSFASESAGMTASEGLPDVVGCLRSAGVLSQALSLHLRSHLLAKLGTTEADRN